MPPIIGRAGRAAHSRRRAGAGTAISGSPQKPPVFTSKPATWSPTITVTGFASVEWAVFQVSTDGQFTSDMLLQKVNVPAGTPAGAPWTFTPATTIKGDRDRLIVKDSFNAPTKEWVSDGAVFNVASPGLQPGPAAVRAFVAPLTVGMNIERGQAIWNGYITEGRCQYYRDLGITHLRFFPPVGGQFGQGSADDLGYLFDACERAMAVPGMRILVAALDVCGVGDLQQGWVMPYLARFGEILASRNWDVTKYAVGAVNEYAWDDNASFRPLMHEAAAILRSKLPNSIILVAGAMWNDPGALLGEKPYSSAPEQNPFVPPPGDDRILVEWHKYDDYAHTADGANYWQGRLSAWSQQTGLTTINGEWQRGPADGGGGIVADQNYLMWPEVIGFSVNMWPQRPTFWTVCGDPNTYWRANEPGTGKLYPNVETALKAADAAIRAKPEWQALQTADSGGGTSPPPPPPPPPPGGTVTGINVLLRGQSNAYFMASFGADQRFKETLAALCGVPVNLISRLEQSTGDNTHHSSTSHAWVDPYDNSFGWWLSPPGANHDGVSNRQAINYSTDPAGWAANTPMSQTILAVQRHKWSGANDAFVDLRVHWEYDLVMYGGAEAYYRAFAWEVSQRIRAAAGTASDRYFQVYGYCPYVGKTIRAVDNINAAWAADEAERGVIVAGNMMDAVDQGDGSHWTSEGPYRSMPRVAFAVAKRMWDAGLLPSGAVNLSDAPGPGPRMGTPVVTGSNSIRVPVVHDRGTAIMGMSGNIDWGAFYCGWDGGGADATGGSISGNDINLTFPSAIGSNRKLQYCGWPHYRGSGLIIDNWHQIKPSKFNGVPHIDDVVFPLRRTVAPVAF